MEDPFPTGLGKLDLQGTPRGGGSACSPAETNEGGPEGKNEKSARSLIQGHPKKRPPLSLRGAQRRGNP